jgi:hypothetical protein
MLVRALRRCIPGLAMLVGLAVTAGSARAEAIAGCEIRLTSPRGTIDCLRNAVSRLQVKLRGLGELPEAYEAGRSFTACLSGDFRNPAAALRRLTYQAGDFVKGFFSGRLFDRLGGLLDLGFLASPDPQGSAADRLDMAPFADRALVLLKEVAGHDPTLACLLAKIESHYQSARPLLNGVMEDLRPRLVGLVETKILPALGSIVARGMEGTFDKLAGPDGVRAAKEVVALFLIAPDRLKRIADLLGAYATALRTKGNSPEAWRKARVELERNFQFTMALVVDMVKEALKVRLYRLIDTYGGKIGDKVNGIISSAIGALGRAVTTACGAVPVVGTAGSALCPIPTQALRLAWDYALGTLVKTLVLAGVKKLVDLAVDYAAGLVRKRVTGAVDEKASAALRQIGPLGPAVTRLTESSLLAFADRHVKPIADALKVYNQKVIELGSAALPPPDRTKVKTPPARAGTSGSGKRRSPRMR